MPNMFTRLLGISLFAILAGATIMHESARADVFTWVDKSGSINVSNIAPPDGVNVTKVVHTTPEEVAAREAAAREAARQAEVQALAERVRQLEGQVQLASMAPPPMQYRPAPAPPPLPPPMVQYVADPTPPMQYASYGAPSSSYGCDGWQFDCGMWGGYGYYLPSVVVVRAPFRRQPPFHDPHNMAVHQPMRTPRGMSRG
jgi:hypothetical protein